MKRYLLLTLVPFFLFAEDAIQANATQTIQSELTQAIEPQVVEEAPVVIEEKSEIVADNATLTTQNETIQEASNATLEVVVPSNATIVAPVEPKVIEDFAHPELPTDLVERPSYKDVLELYRAQEYQKAYDLLLSKYSNQFTQEYDYYLAIVSLKLELFDEAYSALDRVLIVDPNNLKAHKVFYNLYLQEHNFAEAKKELIFLEKIAALSKEESQEMAQQVEKKEEQAKAEEAAKPKAFRFNTFIGGSIGVGYDSNPLNSALVLDLLPSPSEFFSGTNKQDFTMQSNLFGSLMLENLYGTSFGLDTTAVWYKQDYNQNSDLNLNLYSLITTPTYTYMIYKVYLPIEYQNISMNNSLLLNGFGVGLKGDVVLGDTKIDLGIKNTNRTYNTEDSVLAELNANEFSIKTNLTQIMGESSLRVGLNYASTTKAGGTRTDVDHTRLTLNTALKLKLLGLDFTTAAKYEQASYTDMSRDDQAWGVSIKSTSTYFKIFSNDTEISYYTNESTNSDYSYYKILLTTSFGFGI